MNKQLFLPYFLHIALALFTLVANDTSASSGVIMSTSYFRARSFSAMIFTSSLAYTYSFILPSGLPCLLYVPCPLSNNILIYINLLFYLKIFELFNTVVYIIHI